jgi:hypothetical protein
MIDGSIIKFGFGDVLVGSDSINGVLTITEIEPPQQIGTTHNAIKEGLKEVRKVSFSYGTDFHELICDLNNLRAIGRSVKELRIIQFREYTFDFTNYDEKSVDVVREFVKKAMYPLTIAC